MIVMTARIAADGLADFPEGSLEAGADDAVASSVRAIGVDEKTALLVDPDGTVTTVGNGTAYCCTVGVDSFSDMICSPGQPLSLPKVECVRLAGASFTQVRSRAKVNIRMESADPCSVHEPIH